MESIGETRNLHPEAKYLGTSREYVPRLQVGECRRCSRSRRRSAGAGASDTARSATSTRSRFTRWLEIRQPEVEAMMQERLMLQIPGEPPEYRSMPGSPIRRARREAAAKGTRPDRARRRGTTRCPAALAGDITAEPQRQQQIVSAPFHQPRHARAACAISTSRCSPVQRVRWHSCTPAWLRGSMLES